jgi:TonB family protein
MPAGGLTGAGAEAGQIASEILVYQQEIKHHILNNWVYPETLAGQHKDLEARLVIRMAADGEIKDVQFDKKSGNSYLDDSAYKAILKSNPLPAQPIGGINFIPYNGVSPEKCRKDDKESNQDRSIFCALMLWFRPSPGCAKYDYINISKTIFKKKIPISIPVFKALSASFD